MNRAKCALIAFVAAVHIPTGSMSSQTVSAFDATVLVHGLADNHNRFFLSSQSGTPSSQWNTTINLKTILAPDLPSTSSVAQQAISLRSFLDQQGSWPLRVLVAHSMGGIVQRQTFINNPSSFAGMISIATPHGGTYAANNAATIKLYLDGLITNIDNTLFPAVYMNMGLTVATLVQIFKNSYVSGARTMLTTMFPNPNSPAVTDLRVGSPVLAALASNNADASLPRANVIASLNTLNRNWPFRLLAANDGNDSDLSTMVWYRNFAKSVFKNCKHVGRLTIVFWEFARKCSRVDRAIGALDERLMAYVVGTQANGKARNIPFDGVVAVEKAGYPLLSDPLRKIQANNVNHFSVLFDPSSGVPSTTTAMSRIGMPVR